MAVTVDDSSGTPRTISNDVNTISVNNSRNLIDVTGVDVDAMERLAALRDFEISMTGTFNAAADMSHDVFKNLDNLRTLLIDYGTPTFSAEIALESYNVSRSNDGGLTWQVTGRSAGGVVTWA